MSSSARRIWITLAIVALALVAHGRILLWRETAGRVPVQPHLPSGGGDPIPPPWLANGTIRPVPALILRATDAVEVGGATAPTGSARPLRVVSFMLLLSAAAAAGFALRRALVNWVGNDTARAAGFAAAALFALHPIAGEALAHARALGDLCACAFGAASAALFLRGRQQREQRALVGAAVCAVLAGFSSWSAWFLPVVLAVLEFGSVRRVRSVWGRAQTAATTFVMFGACVLAEWAVLALTSSSVQELLRRDVPILNAWSEEPRLAARTWLEDLGFLFFPVIDDAPSAAWFALAACATMTAIAIWPLFRSARAAPRLWGRLALVWVGGLLVVLVPTVDVLSPPRGDRAYLFIVGALVQVLGPAVAATSLLGSRRIVLPACIALLSAWVAWRGADDLVAGDRIVARERVDIERARREVGEEGRVLVIDPPLSWKGRTLWTPEKWIPGEALPLYLRCEAFAADRMEGLAVLESAPRAAGMEPRIQIIPRTSGSGPPPMWRGESRSALFDLDPASARFARIVALPGTSTAEPPRMSWRASEPAGEWVSLTGVWVEGDHGPVAIFDPWRESAWWSAATIRRVRAEEPLVNVASFELLPAIPLDLVSATNVRLDHLCFEIREESVPRPVRGTVSFVFEFLEITIGRPTYERILCEDSLSGGIRTVRARRAAHRLAGCGLGQDLFAWSLECRVGDVVVARTGSPGMR